MGYTSLGGVLSLMALLARITSDCMMVFVDFCRGCWKLSKVNIQDMKWSRGLLVMNTPTCKQFLLSENGMVMEFSDGVVG